ncbi:unnamed protein product [Microthlaspi erraticum]|uniref:Retrotransposon gag domain-containing protein n=1 Tax=Microthlaspi erraticum TaxID=1685480 RepID=A0A6D2K737_9BRAS|nr:unnamed protein product [Microthlaspi erraticum]
MIAMRRQRYASPEEQSAHICQALAEHMRGEALTWFGSFQTDSIDSFDDLAVALLKRYLCFALNDLVLRKSDDDMIDHLGKFGFSCKFGIARIIKPGVYQLEENLGSTSKRLWSSKELCKFYD